MNAKLTNHALSLGAKINTVFITMLLLFIIFSVYNRTSMSTFRTNYNQQINIYDMTLRLKNTIASCDISINEYIQTGNKTNLADFNDKASQIRLLIHSLENFLSSEDALYLLRSCKNSFNAYYTECSNASFAFSTKSNDYYSRIFYANQINDYLLVYCDELLAFALKESIIKNTAFLKDYDLVASLNNVVMVVVSLVSLGFIIYVVRNITFPLNELTSKAKALSEGDLEVQVKVSNQSGTIEILSKTFNNMAQSIKQMMEDLNQKVSIETKLLQAQQKNVENQKLLNQAVMLALQAQTNPHFLFNTLNTISRTVTLRKNEIAIKMIDSLSNLMRYSLTDPKVPAKLSEELFMVKSYLEIQSFRFVERLTIQTDYSQSINYAVELPRFTLQPFIENAINHGLSNKEGSVLLSIQVKKFKNVIYIRIYDTGVGMDKETLHRINNVEPEIATNHIGISNTKKRLSLFANNNQGIKIYSRKGKGTLVTVKIKEATNV